MKRVYESIPGYSYGLAEVSRSQVSMQELADLKVSAGFTREDEAYLRLAGAVLADQTKQIVEHWRNQIIASVPHLARHSRTPEGKPNPDYLARSNRRFEQWIVDTCMRPYDQDWLNYQQEIAWRHTAPKKNKTDQAQSTAFVPFSDMIAFVGVMNETIKPYLGAKGHPEGEIARMHQAWCKAIHLQIALWASFYAQGKELPGQG